MSSMPIMQYVKQTRNAKGVKREILRGYPKRSAALVARIQMRDVMELTIVHISDLHLGPYFVAQAAESLLFTLEKQIATADLFVLSGDFTLRAKRAQFADARALLERLPAVPRIVVPGNHDVPVYRVLERIFTPYHLYREYISPHLDGVWHGEGISVVYLNTTRPLKTVVQGIIGRWQRHLVRRAFSDLPPQTVRVVVAHHPLLPPPDGGKEPAVRGARAALRDFALDHVDLVLGGHLHRAYHGWSFSEDNCQTSTTNTATAPSIHPTRGKPALIVQAGTSTSARGRRAERGHSSFEVIRVTTHAFELQHWLYTKEQGAFQPTPALHIPRPCLP